MFCVVEQFLVCAEVLVLVVTWDYWPDKDLLYSTISLMLIKHELVSFALPQGILSHCFVCVYVCACTLSCACDQLYEDNIKSSIQVIPQMLTLYTISSTPYVCI